MIPNLNPPVVCYWCRRAGTARGNMVRDTWGFRCKDCGSK